MQATLDAPLTGAEVVTKFDCDNGHRLKTPRGSDLDKRIQLWHTGHLTSQFVLPSNECRICSEETLRAYLGDDVSLVEEYIPASFARQATFADMQLAD